MYPDLNAHYDAKEVLNYELFIGPKGEYYKVKTVYESDENMTHYEWAKRFLEKNNLMEYGLIKTNYGNPNDILINLFGFIRYTHAGMEPIYDLPDKKYGKNVTEAQLDSIFELSVLKKEVRFYEKLVDRVNESTYSYSRDYLVDKYSRR